jgi:hypothetical protein
MTNMLLAHRIRLDLELGLDRIRHAMTAPQRKPPNLS